MMKQIDAGILNLRGQDDLLRILDEKNAPKWRVEAALYEVVRQAYLYGKQEAMNEILEDKRRKLERLIFTENELLEGE